MARTAKNRQERDKAIDNDARKKYWQQQALMWEEAAKRARQAEDQQKQHQEAANMHQTASIATSMALASCITKSHTDSIRKKAIERFKKRKASGSIDPKNIKRDTKRKKATPSQYESDNKTSAQKQTIVPATKTRTL